MRRPWRVIAVVAVVTMALGALIARADIDTDPENMLPSDNPVRVLNRDMRQEFGVRDTLVLGIVNDGGVLDADTLGAAGRLVDEIAALDGVVAGGIVSFKTAGAGADGPATLEETARAAQATPRLGERVVPADGRTLAIYVPLENKGAADDVKSSIEELLDGVPIKEGTEYYFAGLPLAEEEFGRDMFLQMAVLAPAAGFLVSLLTLLFFRNLRLVAASMIVVMLSVIWAMGAMIGLGFTVHIMSSMIPVFLMPIAILDSIHIFSEFADQYPRFNDRRATLRAVYRELAVPVTYTSLTTALAFAALALAPIPPVQVFGMFVALGVVAAWALTMAFIPAFVMLLSERGFERSFGRTERADVRALSAGLRSLGRIATGRPRLVIVGFVVLIAVAAPGLFRLNVNDNPVRWFKDGSEIRVATEELTRRLPGTYGANLVLDGGGPGALSDPAVVSAVSGLQKFLESVDTVGQTISYADAVDVGSAAGGIPPSGAGVERALEAAKAGPGGNLVPSLITADRGRANLQLQLKDGDNEAMERIVNLTAGYLTDNPLPGGIDAAWAGETYLNLVWQDKMVVGMLKAFLTTFAVVLVLMVILFRSLRWAVLAMVPMSLTIGLVYGVAGFSGRDYDMPMAVLSTLVLGIGIDFAIHFIQRYRQLPAPGEGADDRVALMFEEPSRALTRNALIIAIAFIPMLFASLTPYIVVGILMTSIMLLSWFASQLLLPAIITSLRGREAVAANPGTGTGPPQGSHGSN